MRLLLALALVVGCGSQASRGGSGTTSRPGVMPMLSELPGDPGKRDAILDQSAQTPTPEMRKGQTKKEKKAETAAATAAAIIGSAFSTTQNTTIGTATVFDENQVVHPQPPQPVKKDAPDAPAADPDVPAPALVPWVKLGPGDAPAK